LISRSWNRFGTAPYTLGQFGSGWQVHQGGVLGVRIVVADGDVEGDLDEPLLDGVETGGMEPSNSAIRATLARRGSFDREL
jgi:hypothetical protein